MAYFPKMQGGDFPHIDNVNVNQWTNDFDYSRYDSLQMKLTICAVPWDMGEAHIGNRTISGIGNVVYFETPENRDAWFERIPDNQCFRFETKYKDLPHDGYIDVPLPFDIASRFNYIMQEFEPFANADSYVQYEAENGHRKWFWFIREVEYLAPNTTRLHIMDDAFQTWIYDIDITGMILERGHAPLFEVTAGEYLENPLANCTNLLSEDVNAGVAEIARQGYAHVFNADSTYALIVTSSNPLVSWGTKADDDWHTPGIWNTREQGVPSYFAFVFPSGNLSTFLDNVRSSVPQFVQTIKAIAFVSDDMVSLGQSFTFADVLCHRVLSSYTTSPFAHLTLDDFGYDKRYRNIAKLYTYPYAKIVITDENGSQTEIKIENTNGNIEIESSLNLVFPWLSVNSHLMGIGASPRSNITFTNVSQRNMPIQGNWYEYVYDWKIPTFGVVQDGRVNNDYATHYDREQQQYAIDNQYANVVESADCLVDNADLAATTNSAITATSNASNASDAAAQNDYIVQKTTTDNQVVSGAATATTQAQEQQASISAASSAASGVMGAIGAAATGNVAGAVSGLVGGAIGAATTMASTAVGVALTNTQAGQTANANIVYAGLAGGLNTTKSGIYQNTQSAIAADQNDLTTGSAANTAAMQLANGARDKATGESGITNQINQAAMNAPSEFGAWNAGQTATTRPMGLFANIVTQNDGQLSIAGDEMLRYGYTLGKQWPFDGNWNIGKHFTYWKLRDFWVRSLNVPDMYMDRIRFFLFGGVTIWRRPEDIGKFGIYENGV